MASTPKHARPKSAEAARPPRSEAILDPLMLDLLVCPLTKGRLQWHEDAQELVSKRARLAYPIRDGVPILLASEAREIDESELA